MLRLVVCIISCLLGYYCVLHYDFSQKLSKETDVGGNDVEMNDMKDGKTTSSGGGGNGGGHNAAQDNGFWTVVWGFATCTCCYEEFM